ncbi:MULTISPECIES: DUF3993 domain-containing protein [unclassified Cytobacillus]|uniref:DUF3993 domain-containing protein n=1 Tax=unclassified Cytobacillus TaxID=2675268 RepID=UPI00203DA827|nr:DUF3993 domain-containing protein [Cytobacillus sp. AMY 15.2]MCM3090342.1 DUF3993 domain-containing protein [Cytobacillus sp. AMY 15.2]
MYKHLSVIITIAVMFALIPSQTYAERNTDKEEVYGFLQNAFQAQMDLSGEERSMNEVNELLDPYFSEEAKNQFLKENLVSENGKYFALGSDSAAYYVPYFTYSDNTKVVEESGNVYVYEYFPENHEGPVGYESHYEGVMLTKYGEEIKVAKFMGEIPEKIIKKAEGKQEAAERTAFKAPEANWLNTPSYQFGFLLNPFEAMFRSGSMLITDSQGINALFEKKELHGQLAAN